MFTVWVSTEPLGKAERTHYETLITIQVHQYDVFEQLVKLKVSSVSDFEWLKQARFYWRNDIQSFAVAITDIDFPYQYEYLGIMERLVVTPLTDRCYVTLAQALSMCMGGNPLGRLGCCLLV